MALEGASLVCVVHISNVLGVRNPIEDIVEMSHSVGSRVLIDCAQGAPHETIDFDSLGADFVAISAHKMAGPTGIGHQSVFLYPHRVLRLECFYRRVRQVL